MIRQQFLDYRQDLKRALDAIPADATEKFLQALESAYQEERQVFLLGNGGSGSSASHAAADLNKGVSYGREKRFRVISLNDNMATVTAYANDVSYTEVFVEQLKNFLHPGDVVIGISGSGNSSNVLKAIEYANRQGAITVGLCGFDGGKLAGLAQLPVHIPVNDMQKVEDIHMMLFHVAMQVLCARADGPAGAHTGSACAAPSPVHGEST
jgi:D-sedoheptulose 7-phosphate isomerase